MHVLYGPAFTNNAIVYHPNPSVSAGFGSAVAAGDFNGDSVPDLFVGEFWFPANGVNRAGRAHVLLGPAYTQAVTFQEPAPGSSNEFGRRVVAADLNGNGRAEIVVGVPSSSRGGGIRAGALYIGSP